MGHKLSARIQSSMFASADLTHRAGEACVQSIERAAILLAETFRNGGKLLLCGNGGSAADCQHVAAEFVSRFRREVDRQALPAIALTTDTSLITAYANDCGYEGVFSRQVEALGLPGDCLMGISTSGSSPNVLRALETARRKNMTTILLSGHRGNDVANVSISVPSDDTQHIQEVHLAIEHCLCDAVEVLLFPDMFQATGRSYHSLRTGEVSG